MTREKCYFVRTWHSHNKSGRPGRHRYEYNRVFHTKKQCQEFLKDEGFSRFGKIFRQKHTTMLDEVYYEFARIDDKY